MVQKKAFLFIFQLGEMWDSTSGGRTEYYKHIFFLGGLCRDYIELHKNREKSSILNSKNNFFKLNYTGNS